MPVWVSFSSSRLASSSGPMSEMVVRTGWPSLPNRSQKITGLGWKEKSSMPMVFTRSSILGWGLPGLAMPERSPFTSAMKTGTPMAEKPSASTCRVTVLPVPVAPAIMPWRLALSARK